VLCLFHCTNAQLLYSIPVELSHVGSTQGQANEIASVAGINVTMGSVLTSAMSLHCGMCHCTMVYTMSSETLYFVVTYYCVWLLCMQFLGLLY